MGVVEFGTALTLRPVAALQTLEFRTTGPMQFIDSTDEERPSGHAHCAHLATGARW